MEQVRWLMEMFIKVEITVIWTMAKCKSYADKDVILGVILVSQAAF